VIRVVLAACIALAACDARPESPPASTSAPPSAAPAAPAFPFVDVAKEAGLTATNHTGIPNQKDWVASAVGGGAIVLDYDQDGLMDLVVVDGTMLTEKGQFEYDDAWRTRVYHNDGGMRFTDVTAKSGVDVKGFGVGGASCDYDGDGWPDFYLCGWGCNRLFHNRGDGTFEDVTDKAGVRGAPDDFSTGCCWGDVNGDGIPDLYVANYVDQAEVVRDFAAHNRPPRVGLYHGLPVYPGPRGSPAQKHRLYFGNGDGTFREVTDTNLGKQDPLRYGFQPVMTDVDNDGDLDIYVANDGVANFLWINDGHGVFVDQALESGTALDSVGRGQSSMGVDVADVNRDGWLDIAVTNFALEYNILYLNRTGDVKRRCFADAAYPYGVAQPCYDRVSWGVKLLDYDNDGELDFFAACGHVYGDIEGFEKQAHSSWRQRCLLLRGKGPPAYGFVDVTDASGPAFADKRVWRGAVFADFDNDGDLDVFMTALNDRPALLRNDVGDKNNFLVFRLVGKGKLRDPCGARVTVWLADGRPRMEELHHGISFCSDNDPRLFFGLGAEKSAKRVEVRWPDGSTQSFENVAARRFYLVEQGKPRLTREK
jgi:hypothetical protein